ncbi:MAG: L-lactate dehydrogenase [Oscillospiraceae bacterium]|nr:L-lactate dehydrogenase [Oscillospiraceae bacterium]
MFKGKISIIGAGFVGSTTAYTLMLSGLASEIVLVDINKNKAEGDAMDMNHGITFVSPVKITSGDYSLIKNSAVVIVTAGVNQKPGETRIDLLKRNTEVFKNIISEILKYCDDKTVILVVTNPVDILTYIAEKLSGLPRNNVIGSGTVLDTARLKYLIGEHTNIDVRDVHTYIIGEHGDTEVPAWSITSIAGVNIDEYCQICKMCDNNEKICKSQYEVMTKNAAYDIIDKKGATYYAVALAVRRIVESITGNENSILTVSSYLDGEYGIRDVCLSVPTIVNARGIEKVIEVPFDGDEIKALRHSAATLKELASQIGF